jgi:ribosome-associated protein
MDDSDWDDAPPSKSAKKREMHALQAIGERLVVITDTQLATIPIQDESLREAVLLARRIKARGGLRRQLQFIGKLMRSIDDPQPIIDALEALDQAHQSQSAQLHRLEHFRDRLLNEGDDALGDAVQIWPEIDRGHIRQLLRQHQRASRAGQQSPVGRALFRYLRDVDNAADSD